jgi:prepilin-type N-terminal cleavage/methylation domain-containing protein
MTRARRPFSIRARRGMTLVEVVVSLVILAGAVLGMGIFVTRFSRSVTDASIRTTADQLAADRLEEVKGATRYTQIDTLFAGITEANPQGYTGFTRRTLVKRIGGAPSDIDDYKIITVIVTTSALPKPVSKTTIISVF